MLPKVFAFLAAAVGLILVRPQRQEIESQECARSNVAAVAAYAVNAPTVSPAPAVPAAPLAAPAVLPGAAIAPAVPIPQDSKTVGVGNCGPNGCKIPQNMASPTESPCGPEGCPTNARGRRGRGRAWFWR